MLKAMSAEPEARYATAHELADDLRRFLADVPIHARRPSFVERSSKWSRRHQPLVWSTLALLLTTTVILGIALLLISRLRTEALLQREEARQQREAALDREASLRRHLYAADVNRAWQAWGSCNVAQARALLAAHRPNDGDGVHNFAWHYLWRQCHVPFVTLRKESRATYALAYSPDGTLLASGGNDRVVTLWDPATRQALATFEGHTDDVNHIAFSPDGKLLLSTSEDQTLRLWDLDSRQLRQTWTGFTRPVAGAFFTPDGQTLAVAQVNWQTGDCQTSLWDVTTGTQTATLNAQRVFAMSGDGQQIVTGNRQGWLRLLQIPAMTELAAVRGHTSEIVAGALRSDGRLLVTADRNGTVKLWTCPGLQQQKVLLNYTDAPRSLVISPDGSEVAMVAGDGFVRIWDTATGEVEHVLDGHAEALWSVAFAPDGKTVASAGSSDIRLWNIGDASRHTVLHQPSQAVRSMAFLPDNVTLVTCGGDALVRFWNLQTGELTSTVEFPGEKVVDLAAAPAKDLLAFGTLAGKTYLRDLTGRVDRRPPVSHAPPIVSVALSLDGAWLATFEQDKQKFITHVWDCRSGLERHTISWSEPRAGWHLLCFSPDGRTLVTQLDSRLCLIDLATGEQRLQNTDHYGKVACVTFSPEGHVLATGSRDGTASFMNVATGQSLTTLFTSHILNSMAFSPDGTTFVTGNDGGQATLWDVATGREITTLAGPHGSIHCVAFSPDGTRLAVSSGPSPDGDMEINVWHSPPDIPHDLQPGE